MRIIIGALCLVVMVLGIVFITLEPFKGAMVIGMLLFLPSLIMAHDLIQNKRAILKNFPFLGHFRYLMEAIRPGIHQYFVEDETDGRPFNREKRNVIYQRSKKQLDTQAFGTKLDVYDRGYEWVNHSLVPKHVDPNSLKIRIGSHLCQMPYEASILNISAMSFGALSKTAILALSKGAKMGGFAHNTGEGGVSDYHLEGGGNLIWQIGTGYFGCRKDNGDFDVDHFEKTAKNPSIKMIELKLSQGAKPSHGGILPKEKITDEIARIRKVAKGKDVVSPPNHKNIEKPVDFCFFIKKLRDHSGGKPIGIKLCLGKRHEFLSLIKAFIKTKIIPDYIVIDGAEGGTGAAPLEFANHIGSPLVESLIFARNVLVATGLKSEITLLASGKVTTAFDALKLISLGADGVYSARSFMFSLGCIQALKCNSNHCPTGVATQNPYLAAGLDPQNKSVRVFNFHKETLKNFSEMLGAMGLKSTSELKPWHLVKRISGSEIKHYGQIYKFYEQGQITEETAPSDMILAWQKASSDRF